MTRTHHQIGDVTKYGVLVRRGHDGQSWIVRRPDGRCIQIQAQELRS